MDHQNTNLKLLDLLADDWKDSISQFLSLDSWVTCAHHAAYDTSRTNYLHELSQGRSTD